MMCSIIEDLLPPSYFSSLSLLGVQADQLVLNHLLPFYLPELDARLKEYEISKQNVHSSKYREQILRFFIHDI